MYNWVGITLVRGDGAVLVQHRDNKPEIPSPNLWGVCGGKKEKEDRDLKDTAIRELFEETGYLANKKDLVELDSYEFQTDNGRVRCTFYGADYDGIQPISCFEGQEIRFITKKELGSLEICDYGHRHSLERASG